MYGNSLCIKINKTFWSYTCIVWPMGRYIAKTYARAFHEVTIDQLFLLYIPAPYIPIPTKEKNAAAPSDGVNLA